MSHIPIKHLRNKLTPDDIVKIIQKFGVDPVADYPDYLLYPTINHNLDGGSHKLYYYKNNKMFKAYTGEAKLFDIFQLVIDMQALRGIEMSLPEAISFCGLNSDEEQEVESSIQARQQLEYLQEMNEDPAELEELIEYPKTILNNYVFDLNGLMSWIGEGISIDTLREFDIKYNQTENSIIIPYFTKDHKLVGVRGRFLNEDAKAKYMPVRYGGRFLTHPTGRVLYGLNVNEEAIRKQKMAVIFEGEKSVMKMNTYFGRTSTALAVSGRRFSKDHLKMLLDLGVRDIVVAFDRDYSNREEIEEEIAKLKEMFAFATNRVNVSLIIDFNLVLGYKDSPADKGKEIFDILIEDRVFI